MPVSWLPLVADFARHGRDGNSALRGTWLGYAIANIWCYALGVLVAITTPSTDLVAALLLAQGGLVALGLILIDEVDNAYGDLYSGSVAGHSLKPAWSLRRWGVGLALLCTALALVLPMHSLEPFLLMLSSVFVPLYGVILARLAGTPQIASLVAGAQGEHQRRRDLAAGHCLLPPVREVRAGLGRCAADAGADLCVGATHPRQSRWNYRSGLSRIAMGA